MKKHILLPIVCVMLLSACGKIEDDNDSKTAPAKESAFSETVTTSAAQETTVTSVTTGAEKTAAEKAGAEIKVKNSMGDVVYSELDDAEALLSFAEKVYNDSDKQDDGIDHETFSVHINSGDDEYIYSYCGHNDLFKRTRKGDLEKKEPSYFTPDKENAEKLRDMMLAYSVLGIVFKDNDYTVVPEHIRTDHIAKIAADIPSDHFEIRYYYVNDRDTRVIFIETEGDKLFYSQETSSRTDVTIEDTPYYQTSDFYDYCTDGKGKAYYRPETYDVFYPAEKFDGDMPVVPLAKSIAENGEYLYSFKVKTDGGELPVEVCLYEKGISYVMLENGAVKAMWSFNEDDGVKLMHSFRTEEVESGDIDEIIAHAEQHLFKEETDQEELPKSNEEWIKYDTEKYGLFDLSGKIKIGKEVEPTGVVEEWRKYISSGTNPFTLEFRWAGAGRNEYEISTSDGKNYYYRNDMDIHDKTDNLGSEEWLIDGRFFQSIYPTNDYDGREITEWEPSEYSRVPIELLFEDEQQGDDYAGKCERAYEVTINNEKYICEEWSLMLGRLWKVYIKDGSIAAWEGDFYNEPAVYTVIRLEKTADSSLIKIPEGAKKHVPND